jgi:hypothetical protein
MSKGNATVQTSSVTMRVRIGDAEIEITGPAAFVKAEVNEFLERTPVKATSSGSSNATTSPSEQSLKTKSPAQFFKMCNPRSDVDRTLVGAYYLEKHRNAQNFSAAEIRNVIKDAKVPPPRNANDAVNQNIRKGLIMTAGDRESKMVFVLTSDGEVAVEQMMGNVIA